MKLGEHHRIQDQLQRGEVAEAWPAETAALFPAYYNARAPSVGKLDAATALHQGSQATEVMLALINHLDAAEELLGSQRFQDILVHVKVCDARAADSVASLAKALALADEVPLPEDDLSLPEDERPRKILKNAKLALRNALLWQCIGWAKGLDSQEALAKRFPAFKDAAQTRAQLINGFSKIRDASAKLLTGAERALPLNGGKPKRPKGSVARSSASASNNDADAENLKEPLRVAEPCVLEPADLSPMKVSVEDLFATPHRNEPSPSDPKVLVPAPPGLLCGRAVKSTFLPDIEVQPGPVQTKSGTSSSPILGPFSPRFIGSL